MFREASPLVALAYRMLGDVGRAQDMVQEAWLRWHGRDLEVESPKAFLVTVVTRLCLNELGSARARREESRSDRLPEPVNLEEGGMSRLEDIEQPGPRASGHGSRSLRILFAHRPPTS